MRRFEKILFLFMVGFATGAPGKVESPADIDVSPDRRIFGSPKMPLVEPYLAVDSVHPNHLVARSIARKCQSDCRTKADETIRVRAAIPHP
jgi:hypothetical protein